jgi:hypothetical protein
MKQQTLGDVPSAKRDRVESAISEPMDIHANQDGTFEVKGQYEVDPQTPSCTCPDHQHRQIECKHIVRVTLELMWNNLDRITESDDPPRPQVLDPLYDNIPDLLTRMEHWVGWKQELYENKDGSKRWTKVPVNVHNGEFGSSTDDSTWTVFKNAEMYSKRPDTDCCGIGFVVSEDDAVIGLDIDDCRNPETGQLDDAAARLIQHANTYAEVSPSGTGVRLFLLGDTDISTNQVELPGDAHVEMYYFGRYLTVTGHHIEGTPKSLNWDADTLECYERLMTGDSLDDALAVYDG